MTPTHFRYARQASGLSERGVATLTGYSAGAVRGWVTGQSRVPDAVAEWLYERAMALAGIEPPVREGVVYDA